jgi:hypothetical protein
MVSCKMSSSSKDFWSADEAGRVPVHNRGLG